MIREALGRTPEVTIDGRLLANNATNGSAGELIEVRTFHERVLDRIRLPVESEVNLTGTDTRSVAAEIIALDGDTRNHGANQPRETMGNESREQRLGRKRRDPSLRRPGSPSSGLCLGAAQVGCTRRRTRP